jgi:hypothetical protein
MGQIARSVVGVVAGVILGMILMMGIEFVGQVIYPLPPGVDPNDFEALKALLATMPVGALLFVLLGWFVAPLAGGFIAAWIARRAPVAHALVVGLFFLAGGIAMLMLMPHPVWFAVVGGTLFLPAAYTGALLAGPLARRGLRKSGSADAAEAGV